MTISSRVKQQLFAATSPVSEQLIRLPPTVVTQYAKESRGVVEPAKKKKRAAVTRCRRTNLWTIEEHERFLAGLEQFPHGPWKEISTMVGTKTTRQTMTHAQKYRQKIERRIRIGTLYEPPQPSVQVRGKPRDSKQAKQPKPLEPACDVLPVGGSPHSGDTFFDPSIFDEREFTSLLEEIEPRWKAELLPELLPESSAYETVYCF